MLTRFGKYRFGYIWAFIEPVLYIVAFAGVRSFVGSSSPFGENALLFFLIALLTFRTSMSIVRRTGGAIDANMPLLALPPVKTFDVVLARIVVEAVTWSVVSVAFVLGLWTVSGLWAIARPDVLLPGYLAALYLGASLGFLVAMLTKLVPFFDRFMALISLPLMVMSGIFYLPIAMPPQFLAVIWFNPFLHAVEWVRSGVFYTYEPVLSRGYLLWFATCCLFLGLLLNKLYQRRLYSTA
jgi:capsular polysaccharide transport system permease protein